MKMHRRKLGRTDLFVSELGFDTIDFGCRTNETSALTLLDHYRAAGGNFVQTCSVSAAEELGAAATGEAETYVRAWMQRRGIRRDEIVLSSRHTVVAGRHDLFRTTSLIRRHGEESLQRLGVRYLDLLVFAWREGMPMEETLLAAESLVRAGLVRHVALSGFPAWRVMAWLAHAQRRNYCRPAMIENELPLVSNAAVNTESLALAREHELGFVARAPLAGGFRADRFQVGGDDRARLSRPHGSSTSVQTMQDTVRAIAEVRGASAAGVAVAWVLAHAGISSASINVSTVAQLDELIAGVSLSLSISDMRRLDDLWRARDGETSVDGSVILARESTGAADPPSAPSNLIPLIPTHS